ncbi:MAG TPA: response regulator transcription factor [Chloroflexota bacterium]|nr:response regulator transcription factor [Chloroflexota bacterium]
MNGPRVLVVDDEPQIRRALRVGLASHGYQVQVAASGEEALALATHARPEVVILDLVLPGLDGLEVCQELRRWSPVPIIVLSARGQERDKVQALDLGADDYLTKPFGMDELLARIRAALRRAGASPSPVLESGELRLDQARRVVTLRGAPVHLTPTEYDILRYLMANAGKVVTHRALLAAVWGPGYQDSARMLRVFIAQLRRKIEPVPARPTYIRTEPAVGYRFRDEA